MLKATESLQIHLFLQIIHVQFFLFFKLSKCKIASEAIKWINSVPPNSSNDLCLLFCIYPSSIPLRNPLYLSFYQKVYRKLYSLSSINSFTDQKCVKPPLGLPPPRKKTTNLTDCTLVQCPTWHALRVANRCTVHFLKTTTNRFNFNYFKIIN